MTMKAIKFISTTGLLIGAALSLAACGQNNKNAAKTAKKFPEQTPQKTAKQGGTLTYAIETDTPLKEFLIVSYQLIKWIQT